MLLLLQAAAPAAETIVEDGFSKLQVFLQQLIDWGVNAGGHIIGAVLIFIVGRFLISFLNKMVARLLAKRHPKFRKESGEHLADYLIDYCRYR